MAKGLLGSRYNKEPRRKNVMGIYSSFGMTMPETQPTRPETERYIFATCKGERTRKKAKNTFSKEEAGTCGNIIVTKRFRNSRLTCVCKTRNWN